MSPQEHKAKSYTQPDLSSQLIRLEAKLDARLDLMKEQIGDLKKDIKPIQEHILGINAAVKLGGKLLLGSGVLAVCARFLISLF